MPEIIVRTMVPDGIYCRRGSEACIYLRESPNTQRHCGQFEYIIKDDLKKLEICRTSEVKR